MIELNDEQVGTALDWHRLADRIEHIVLRGDVDCAPRGAYTLPHSASLLLMPAWRDLSMIGLKTVVVCPDNAAQGLASHAASYILMDARTATVIATMDAHTLTHRRTAAVSALATRRLMRPEARRALVIGTGPVAEALLTAYHALLPFETLGIYGRDTVKAEALAVRLQAAGIACSVEADIAAAAASADVISMATSAHKPLLQGSWLRPGTHIDLVGSFTPAMRETDDEVMSRAAEVWIDTSAATDESGDLIDPLLSGVLTRDRLRGTLVDLLMRRDARPEAAITVFKAVGFAVPDFAAAQCVLERTAPKPLVRGIA